MLKVAIISKYISLSYFDLHAYLSKVGVVVVNPKSPRWLFLKTTLVSQNS